MRSDSSWKFRIAALAIVLFGGLLRTIRLNSIPPALFRDEAEKIWNAKYLWDFGTDSDGNSFPLFIKVFGVTTSAIYQYFAIPFVAIGGVNEWTTRLPAAVIGTATIALCGVLSFLLGGRKVSLFAMLFLSLSPWHIHFSRWAQQGIFVPFFLTIAMIGLALFLRKEDANEQANGRLWENLGLIIASIAASFAMYSYEVARLFVPMLGIVLCCVFYKDLIKKYQVTIIALIAGVLALAPVIYLNLYESKAAQVRFQFLSIFNESKGWTQTLNLFFKNYIAHFSPDFLLLRGDKELRHSADVGVLTFPELFLAATGLYSFFKHRNPWGILFGAWILLAPVPASLTKVGIPHALRTIAALPAWQLCAGFGAVYFIESIRKLQERNNRISILVFIALLGSVPYLKSYFGSYAGRSAFDWQYGLKDALSYIRNYSKDNKIKVYLHNIVGAEYLLPVYGHFSPREFKDLQSGKSDTYVIMPFQFPDRQSPIAPNEPAVYISPLGYYWNSDFSFIPISGPDGENSQPVLGMYINNSFKQMIMKKLEMKN